MKRLLLLPLLLCGGCVAPGTPVTPKTENFVPIQKIGEFPDKNFINGNCHIYRFLDENYHYVVVCSSGVTGFSS